MLAVFGAEGDRLVDTGRRCFRNVVPMQRLLDAGITKDAVAPRCWMGPYKVRDYILSLPHTNADLSFVWQHLISYPIGDGSVFNVAAFATDRDCLMVPAGPQSSWADWVVPASRAELNDAFVDFGTDARAIMGQVDEMITKWKMHGLYPPLETHIACAPSETGDDKKENVVIIGDAAHAMVPYLGSGASTGIEDAYVLANLLGHPQTSRGNLSVRIICVSSWKAH